MTTSPGGPAGRPDNDSKNPVALQKTDRQAALAALRQPSGPAVDLHEIAPVMATFREHLAREQEQNRRRVRGLVTGFAVALLVVALVPVYLARQVAGGMERQIAAQRETQESQAKLVQSMSDGMAGLAASSRQLQEELLKDRQLLAAAVTAAPPMIVVTAVVPVTVTAPAPVAPQPPVAVQPLQLAPAAIPPVPSTALGVLSAPAGAPPRLEPGPAPAPVPAVGKLSDQDLSALRRKVEQDIQTRRAALERSPSAGRSP